MSKWGVVAGIALLVAGAVGLGNWAGMADLSSSRSAGPSPAAVDARLRELGLTEDQLQGTIQRGIENFILEQQQAQVRAEAQREEAMAARLRPIDPAEDFLRGAVDAEFSMIEYSDFECPFCKRFHSTAASFARDNPSLNWAHRHFPLRSHDPQSTMAAVGAECVGSLVDAQAYWQYTDAYYSGTRSGGRGVEGQSVVDLMVAVGVEVQAAARCLEDPNMIARVQAMSDEGQSAGVTGTPGIFIRHNPSGQVMRVPGAVPLPQLQNSFNQFRASVGG
ncbi:DsbA family protein [Salinispirillum sp. LH 10-3-1]|uniref:DsbA family protein n=1 Tax=Salinispirillum sp. LH 10-3-1 TaxID=2952525 RepID=A0AB38YIC7_9GAMM